MLIPYFGLIVCVYFTLLQYGIKKNWVHCILTRNHCSRQPTSVRSNRLDYLNFEIAAESKDDILVAHGLHTESFKDVPLISKQLLILSPKIDVKELLAPSVILAEPIIKPGGWVSSEQSLD